MFIPDRAQYFRALRKKGSNVTEVEYFEELPTELHVVSDNWLDSDVRPVAVLPEVMANADNQYLQERAVQAITDNKHKLPKQARYQDATGGDWIDEAERTLSWSQFCGAMIFTIGKYLRRFGKKDAELQEIEKIADYANRWLEAARRKFG